MRIATGRRSEREREREGEKENEKKELVSFLRELDRGYHIQIH